LQKVHVRNFPRKIDKNFDVSLSSILGVSQRWEFKNTTKKHFAKIVSKSVCQKIDKKIQNRFFLDFVLSRFWAFLGEGSSKTRQKKSRKKLTSLGTFSAADHVGSVVFWFERPLGMDFRGSSGWPGPKGAGTPVEMGKSISRAGGTAGAVVPPQTTRSPGKSNCLVPW
jgi:hypothetical protein